MPTLPERALVAAAIILSAATGCRPPSASFATATSLPTSPRRPDGVALDPTSAPPPVSTRADASDGLVTLRSPLGLESALATLRRFFDGVVAEDLTELSALASPSALVSDVHGSTLERVHNYGFLWRSRFGKFDYLSLERDALYRERDVEVFEAADAEALPRDLVIAASGEPLGPDDLVIRVRMLGQSTKTERLFGETLTFWLRRDDERFVIHRIAEDVPL